MAQGRPGFERRGSELALQFETNAKSIAQQLIKEGVASSIQDVDQVLMLGFNHLYGPGGIVETA